MLAVTHIELSSYHRDTYLKDYELNLLCHLRSNLSDRYWGQKGWVKVREEEQYWFAT